MHEDATAPLVGQIPVAKDVTSNMLDVDSVHMDGAVRFSKLAYGTYYLVEEDVPEGYVKNEKPVRVICDRMGSVRGRRFRSRRHRGACRRWVAGRCHEPFRQQ